jgi:hypothetical protein
MNKDKNTFIYAYIYIYTYTICILIIIPFKKGCSNRAVAEGRDKGSFWRHCTYIYIYIIYIHIYTYVYIYNYIYKFNTCDMKSFNSILKLPSKIGGGFFGIKNITCIGWISLA